MKIINKFLLIAFVLTCSVGAAYAQVVKADNISRGVIKFAYLADLHISDGPGPSADLERSVKDINSIVASNLNGEVSGGVPVKLSFVILAGDITEFGSDSEILSAKSILDKLTIPYYIVAGNHDSKWSESGCNTFARVFGFEHFNFEKGGIEFIGCNSGPNMRMAPALVPRESIVWLDSLTKALPADKPVIFINHYPLDDAMLNFQEVLDLIGRTNIQVALCGHGHNNSVLNYPGRESSSTIFGSQLAYRPDIKGIMGRSNLSGRNTGAGYNIITVADGKITFCERVNGVTKNAWKTLKMTAPSQEKAKQIASTQSIPGTPVSASGSTSVTSSSAISYTSTTSNSTVSASTSTSASSGVSSGVSSVAASVAASGESSVASSGVKVVWEIQDNSDIGSGAIYVAGVGVDKEKSAGVVKSAVVVKSAGVVKPAGEANSLSAGVVYYANTAGVVPALDAASGSLLWSYATKGKIFSTPAVENGRLVVGSSDNSIYCLDATNGTLLWKVDATKSVLASPTIYKGIVYIGSSDGIFRAINLTTGKLAWTYDHIKGFIEAKAWVDDKGVYIGDWASTLYAFNPADGTLLWSWTNGKGRGLSPAAVWPVKANGKIFVVTPERMTHALDAATGQEIWRAKGGREALGLSSDGSAIYVKTMQDTVIAFSTKFSVNTPAIDATKRNTPNSVNSIPAQSNQSAKSLSAQSNQTANSLPTQSNQTAKSLWRTFTGYGYEIAPSAISTANGLVFIPTDKGNIFALNAADGSVAWKYTFSIALINYVQPIVMSSKALSNSHMNINNNDKIVAKNLHRNMDRNADKHADKHATSKHHLLVSSMDGKVGILEY